MADSFSTQLNFEKDCVMIPFGIIRTAPFVYTQRAVITMANLPERKDM